MKTLYRLYLQTTPFTERQKAERERASRLLEIPGVLKIKNDYQTVPDILQHLELESDDDIAERSLKNYVAKDGYHALYLVLTEDEWYYLGLRESLYGQSRVVDGQIISYGRPGTVDYAILHRYDDLIRDNFTESTLREWHELYHGLDSAKTLGLQHDNTHYHFYGYATRYKNVPGKHRRWVRKPDPLEAWRALPWHRLPDLTQPYSQGLLLVLLRELVKRLQALVAQRQKKVKPLREWNTARVSQPYGNYNPSLYPLTGHHIGVDHAVVKGTPIYAPANGTLVSSGYTRALGHYLVYKYADNRYLVALHLERTPLAGVAYKAGEELGRVGATGLITGVHSHIEVWTVPVERDRVSAYINADTWREVTRDPLAEF